MPKFVQILLKFAQKIFPGDAAASPAPTVLYTVNDVFVVITI